MSFIYWNISFIYGGAKLVVIHKLVRLGGNGQIRGIFAIAVHEAFQLMGYYGLYQGSTWLLVLTVC